MKGIGTLLTMGLLGMSMLAGCGNKGGGQEVSGTAPASEVGKSTPPGAAPPVVQQQQQQGNAMAEQMRQQAQQKGNK